MNIEIPADYQTFVGNWTDPERRKACLMTYAEGRQSFVPGIMPAHLLMLSPEETVRVLRSRFGQSVDIALDPMQSGPDIALSSLPLQFQSPTTGEIDGRWLKTANMVGINVRSLGSFWNIVKYALTLPAVQDSIHVLPIWEAGVAGSMYGISSWNLNPEFYSRELAEFIPAMNTIDRQLRAVVNLLHIMGKCVGMDVIPHTDRYSQIVLAFPSYFEWLQRKDTRIVTHRADLHEAVEQEIRGFLLEQGPAFPGDLVPADIFAPAILEAERMQLLFGLPEDRAGREARRNMIIQRLYHTGYEPVPGTMAPPYRGLAVDPSPEATNVDQFGQVWRDYVITDPTPMSRVFGPLTRYKLYESKDENKDWELDFEKPRPAVWAYVCDHYYQVQQRFGFDFMRGDMSHVQMRRAGVPEVLDPYYDLLGAVKNHVRAQGVPYFGYFAESFLAPPDVMGYGDEMDHLEASEADTTLGDLQSMVVGTTEFLQVFRRYYDLLMTRQCAPNFTVMTADKDDPRFDVFYVGGNEIRLFIALFLTTMPSYMGLGFETRDTHLEPAPNEHYTKLYVFQEREGPKATRGPYVWGKNARLFNTVVRMRAFADLIWPTSRNRPVRWLLPPDATAAVKIIAWTQADRPEYVFLANLDIHRTVSHVGLPLLFPEIPAQPTMMPVFSTAKTGDWQIQKSLIMNGKHYLIDTLEPGEGRIYRVSWEN